MNNGYKHKSGINKSWIKNKPRNRKYNIPEIVKYYKGLERERTRMLKMKLKNELPMRKVA